ncbi:MAG: hypothetical protein ACK2U6_11710 [Candidatus Promineifilaceae bacterium]
MLTTRAMVLGSLDPRISYETSLYYSTKAVSINYIPGSLTLDPGGWDLANSIFLGDLFGYKYKKELPPDYIPPGSGKQEAEPDWDEYLKRVWEGLKGGAAVQVCQGWMNVEITDDGQMIGPGGMDPFWWEGMEARPDMHYGAVVGMDKSADPALVYMHDPIGGWFGVGRDIEYTQPEFIDRIAACSVPQLKRITHTYRDPGNGTGLDKKRLPEIERSVRERITAKINGSAEVYDSSETWASFLGPGWNGLITCGAQDGLDALLQDLEEAQFQAVLSQAEREPLDIVSYLDLSAYHYAHIAGISAEHLEEQGRTDEWEWLFTLHMLYERMQLSTAQVRAVFKGNYLNGSSDPLGDSVAGSSEYLADLGRTAAKLQSHFFDYPGFADRLEL